MLPPRLQRRVESEARSCPVVSLTLPDFVSGFVLRIIEPPQEEVGDSRETQRIRDEDESVPFPSQCRVADAFEVVLRYPGDNTVLKKYFYPKGNVMQAHLRVACPRER